MQSNNINTFIEKKLKDFSKKNQLRKILNVSFLINQGFKISKLAKLDETNLALKVKESSSVSISHESYINDFIISALTFDFCLKVLIQ